MKLWQLSRFLLDDYPKTWDADAMQREIERKDWQGIYLVHNSRGAEVDLHGQFEVESGGLVRPAPGVTGTMWPHDPVRGVATVLLRLPAIGFDDKFMVDRLVLETFRPTSHVCCVGHFNRLASDCSLGNLYWDLRKPCLWE